jgi:hypothetical protein
VRISACSDRPSAAGCQQGADSLVPTAATLIRLSKNSRSGRFVGRGSGTLTVKPGLFIHAYTITNRVAKSKIFFADSWKRGDRGDLRSGCSAGSGDPRTTRTFGRRRVRGRASTMLSRAESRAQHVSRGGAETQRRRLWYGRSFTTSCTVRHRHQMATKSTKSHKNISVNHEGHKEHQGTISAFVFAIIVFFVVNIVAGSCGRVILRGLV